VCIVAFMWLIFCKYQDISLENVNTGHVFSVHRSVGTLSAGELVSVYYLVPF